MDLRHTWAVLALLYLNLVSALPPVEKGDVLQGSTAPESGGIFPRDLAMPMPRMPALAPKGALPANCPSQGNLCSSGTPYCCSGDGNGGHLCGNITGPTCTQTVICCNNNNGFQICIGNIDFNMPVTININVKNP